MDARACELDRDLARSRLLRRRTDDDAQIAARRRAIRAMAAMAAPTQRMGMSTAAERAAFLAQHAERPPTSWPEGLPCKPSFLLIGAPKSGSTSLYQYLVHHPRVQPPAMKEMCYFSDFKRHLQHYRPNFFTTSWEVYTRGFAGEWPARSARGGRGGRGRGRRQLAGGVGGRGGRRLQMLERAAAAPRVVAAGARGGRAPAQCEAERKLAFEGCPFYIGERHAAAEIRAALPELKLLAVLRNPRERTVSAFNDYVRMGRIKLGGDPAALMEGLINEKVALVRSGNRTLEDFDVRILTSGCYAHGLQAWGEAWPRGRLLLLRAEDFFADVPKAMARVQAHVGLPDAIPPSAMRRSSNRNTDPRKRAASAAINRTLDEFFAPHNEALYRWTASQGIPWTRWT